MGRPPIPKLAQDLVRELALDGLSTAQILRRVNASLVLNGMNEIGEQSVRRYARSFRGEGRIWGLTHESDGKRARLVLEVLDVVQRRTEGRRQFVTIGEANWIVKLREAAPTLPPWQAYRLANLYASRTPEEGEGESTADLDAYLAAEPWHDNKVTDYISRLIALQLPEPPWMLLSDDAPLTLDEYRHDLATRLATARSSSAAAGDPALALEFVDRALADGVLPDAERYEDPRSVSVAAELVEQYEAEAARFVPTPRELLANATAAVQQRDSRVHNLMHTQGLTRADAEIHVMAEHLNREVRGVRKRVAEYPAPVQKELEIDWLRQFESGPGISDAQATDLIEALRTMAEKEGGGS